VKEKNCLPKNLRKDIRKEPLLLQQGISVCHPADHDVVVVVVRLHREGLHRQDEELQEEDGRLLRISDGVRISFVVEMQ
jgi:hypothetical protein